MKSNAATTIDPGEFEYNEELHSRLVSLINMPGNSMNRIAALMRVNSKDLADYVKHPITGRNTDLELKVSVFLRHYEHEFTKDDRSDVKPVETAVCRDICELGIVVKSVREQGVYIGPSGCGKSQGINALQKQYPDAIVIRLDIWKGSARVVLSLISVAVGGHDLQGRAIGFYFDEMVRKVDRWPGNLLVFDDCHFLSPEALESIRAIYDRVRIGILYVGQDEFLDRLRGRIRDRGGRYIYDQIASRICLKRRFEGRISKEDVKAIADSFCPGLDKRCLGFLYKRVQGLGRFRVISHILRVAKRFSEVEGVEMDLTLLREASKLVDLYDE